VLVDPAEELLFIDCGLKALQLGDAFAEVLRARAALAGVSSYQSPRVARARRRRPWPGEVGDESGERE